MFVKALHTLPADDMQAVPLERAIRMNLTAWAETVPALEHIWPGAFHSTRVAFSPDGERLVAAVGKSEIQCFRADTGQPLGAPVSIPVWGNAAMEFAADGRSIWVASTGQADLLDQWALHRLDPVSGRAVQPPIPTSGPVNRLAVTPDGRFLAGAVWELHPGDRGPIGADAIRKLRTASIVVWDAATGRVVRQESVKAWSDEATANQQPDTFFSLTPDGKSVTAWVERGTNRFEQMSFTVDGNEPAVRLELPEVGTVAPWRLHFDNNMRTALAIKDGQLYRWSATTPAILGPGVAAPFRAMLYGRAADGRSVTSPVDGRVFDTGAWPPRRTGVRFNHPAWQRSQNAWMEQSPDGRFSATWVAQTGGGGRLWRLPRSHSRPAPPSADMARQAERPAERLFARFDPSGSSVALWANDRERAGGLQGVGMRDVHLVDVATGAVRRTSIRHSTWIREVVFTPDGRYFATGSADRTARVWETATGRPAGPALRHTNYVATVAFSPDGNTLAAGDYGPAGLIKFWDWRTGNEVRPPLRHDDIVLNISWSHDGKYLAASKAPDWSKNPEMLVWEFASATVVIQAPYAPPSYVLTEAVRFRPDNRAVAARDATGALRLWEVPTGRLLGERPLDGDGVTRFSPDGRLVAAAANLGVRLFDGNTLAPLQAGYLSHPDPITDVAFSPNGAFLLTGHETGCAQIWDVVTRKAVGPPAVLIGAIRAVTFTPDGQTCLCVAADGSVRRWPVPAPFVEPELARLDNRIALMTGQRMDDNQGLDAIAAEEWRDLRLKLADEGSTALVPPRPDADWHDGAAADAEQDADVEGAEWHLSRLAILRPKDWTIPARRGRLLARAGRLNEAAVAYDAATPLAPSRQVLADWLRAAAADEEAARRLDIALWNIDRAIRLTPDDWVPFAIRAALADEAGRAEQALADFNEAIRLNADTTVVIQAADRAVQQIRQPADWRRVANLLAIAAKDEQTSVETRYCLAIACLKSGDRAGYRAACAGIAPRLPQPGMPLSLNDALGATRAYVLGPGAADDMSVPLAWSARVLTRIDEREAKNPNLREQNKQLRNLFLHARGAAQFRAGQFDDALKSLREGMILEPEDNDFHDWLFIAIAEHHLGHADAAKDAAAKARVVKQEFRTPWDRAEVELLTVELDAALPMTQR